MAKLNKDLQIGNTNINLETVVNNCIYSTAEQIIGKWINNKPLYRKVISISNLVITTSLTTYPVGLINPDKIVKIDLSMRYSNNHWFTFWHLTDITYDPINNKILLYGDSTATFPEAYIIIEYTKTTD
jgi:hypothetical protein